MNKSLIILVLSCITACAQLAVTVSPPEVTGQKTVVQLTLKNNLTNDVKAARAICFLLDEQGKMIGQSTQWVIGQNKTSLDTKGESKFNFVITTLQPLVSSNLSAKVVFSRVIFDDGKMADVRQVVEVIPAKPDNGNAKSQ